VNEKILYLHKIFTYGRKYLVLEAIGDNFEKIVVSLDDIALPMKEGIKHIRAWELFNNLKENHPIK